MGHLGSVKPECMVSGSSSAMLHNTFSCISLAFGCLWFVNGKWKRGDAERSVGVDGDDV